MSDSKFSEDRFLCDYWKRKPNVIRGLYPSLPDLTGEDLAGLALEPEAASRLILQSGGSYPYQVKLGPFKDGDFKKLPDSGYSLLVQAVERFFPQLEALKAPFQSIARWRFDDIMVSYAPAGSGVGPHFDNYDVFLVQGEGKRRWKYHSHPVANKTLLPDIDVQILKQPVFDSECELNSGDVLYIPAGFAHSGESLENSITFSIGFRAPDYKDILGAIAGLLPSYYQEPYLYGGKDTSSKPNQLSKETLRDVRDELRTIVDNESLLEEVLGRLVTEPRSELPFEADKISAEKLAEKFSCGEKLIKAPGLRFIFGEVNIYIESKVFPIKSEKHQKELEALFITKRLDASIISTWTEITHLDLAEWASEGYFWWEED